MRTKLPNDIYLHEALDIYVPRKKDDESFEEYADRLVPYIEKDLKQGPIFTTGNKVLRPITGFFKSNPTEEDLKRHDIYNLRTDCIIDALQKNGFTAYEGGIDGKYIIDLPCREDNESIEEFADRLDKIREDFIDGKYDDKKVINSENLF